MYIVTLTYTYINDQFKNYKESHRISFFRQSALHCITFQTDSLMVIGGCNRYTLRQPHNRIYVKICYHRDDTSRRLTIRVHR